MNLITFAYNLMTKLHKFPWNRYAKEYCDNHFVKFANKDSVLFLGQVHLQFALKQSIRIGNNFVCRSGPEYSFDNGLMSKIVVNEGATLHIGDNTGISNTLIHCNSSITIGSNVKIGGGTMIFDSNFHSVDYLKRRDSTLDRSNAKNKAIIIEDDVFIGARVIICKGVTVGARSIIQTGAVVTESIPSDCIAGGNPCRVIKSFL